VAEEYRELQNRKLADVSRQGHGSDKVFQELEAEGTAEKGESALPAVRGGPPGWVRSRCGPPNAFPSLRRARAENSIGPDWRS
jgi:hypothetical protein